MNELVFAEVQATDMEPMVRVAVLEKMSATMFAYIDWMSQQVVEVYEEERERWLENQNSLRVLRVREILAAKTPVDVDAAASTIRYPLRWHHLAVVPGIPRPAVTATNCRGCNGSCEIWARPLGWRRAHCSWPPTPCAAGDGCPSAPPHPKRRQSPPVRGHPCGLAQCGNRLDGGGRLGRISTNASQRALAARAVGAARRAHTPSVVAAGRSQACW
jgi:hypothetical protein